MSEIRTGPFGSVLHAEDYVSDGTPIVTTEHFKTGSLPVEKECLPQVSDMDYNRLNSYKLERGDIVFSRVGSVDVNALVEEEQAGWLFSGRVLRVRPQRTINGRCLHYLLETNGVKNDIISRAVGQTMPSINTEILNATTICMPDSQDEQYKIGEYFANLDNLIALHESKVAKLNCLKKAYLSELFPRPGEKVPRRRFKGFTGDWEQRKLDEVVNRYDNLRVPVAANLRKEGTTPYYGANGIQDYVEGFTHEGKFVLVAEDGANDLKNYPVQYVEGRIWVNNHAHVIQAKENKADNKFLSYAISQADIESLLVGGGRAKLNANIMMEMEIIYPNVEEQEKIGEFFADLDNLITLYQRKLEKLQALKKAYLAEMFV